MCTQRKKKINGEEKEEVKCGLWHHTLLDIGHMPGVTGPQL